MEDVELIERQMDRMDKVAQEACELLFDLQRQYLKAKGWDTVAGDLWSKGEHLHLFRSDAVEIEKSRTVEPAPGSR